MVNNEDMKHPKDYDTIPSFKQYLLDGGVEDSRYINMIIRMCEMSQFDPEPKLREAAMVGLHRHLPFEPVFEVIDGQLFLRPDKNSFRLYIGDEKDIKANYFKS